MRKSISYSFSAVERAMKVQEVILRAVDGRLKWYQAAEILGISDRQMRRWRGRYEEWTYDVSFPGRCFLDCLMLSLFESYNLSATGLR